MKKLMMTLNLCLCFYLFTFAQQIVAKNYKYSVHFETDQDQLTSHAKSKLEKRLADYISKDIQSIRIIGHADAHGNSNYNIDLSLRRTQNVQAFLNQNGFNHFLIHTHHKGENEPLIIDDSEMGLQANRRVEIWFMTNEVIPQIITQQISCGNTFAPIRSIEDVPEQDLRQIKKPLTSYQQFHQQMDKENQIFSIHNQEGGLLKGETGTLIYFYPNSFCDCNTEENIEGDINIQLKEYYQISDFIQAGLNTNANDKMLQSAGTIHIDALQNNRKVCLKKRQEYHILFPKNKMNKEDYSDMNLFAGNMDDKGEVNWGVMRKDGLKNEEAINFLINNGYNCSGCGGFKDDCKKLNFFVRTRKFFTNHRSWKTYKFCRSKEGRISIQQSNQRVRTARNTCSNQRNSIVKQFEISFEEFVQNLKKNEGEWEEYLFNYYITSSSRLNYINCDRFTNFLRRELRTVKIPLDSKNGISVKIIIKSVNGILSGYPVKGGKFAFGKLPKGKKAEILAYDYSSEKPKVAKHSFRIGDAVKTEDLVFEEYSITNFKKYLSNLN